MAKSKENLVDEGFRVSLVETAFFDGMFEIPHIDAPLCVQIADIYLNRAVGFFLKEQGIYVIPNIRWGDERTYTTELFPEKVAFQGVDKHSIVSIGTYGQIKSAESKRYFREGLVEMLDELKPEVVLVYGSMPKSIFGDLLSKTRFVQFDDWTTRMKSFPRLQYMTMFRQHFSEQCTDQRNKLLTHCAICEH